MNHGLIPFDEWTRDQHAIVEKIIASRDIPVLTYSSAFKEMKDSDNNQDVFLWKAEEKLFGKKLPAFYQSMGTCVSKANARAAQDQLLIECALRGSQLPDNLKLDLIVASEPIYVGSRQEIGGGKVSGDGSIDSWAHDWLMKYGVSFRIVYTDPSTGKKYDLTKEDDQITVQWEATRDDVPPFIELQAKDHPIKDSSKCPDGDTAWTALGSLNGVTVPSSQGFTTTRVKGICKPSGRWDHDMYLRGRCTLKGGNRAGIIQQSWGQNNPGGDNKLDLETGETIELPNGCFAAYWEYIDKYMIRAGRDSNVTSGVKGFRRSGPVDYDSLV